MDISKMIFNYLSLEVVKDKLISGEWVIDPDDSYPVVDMDSLPDAARKKFAEYKKCMQEVVAAYGPTFMGLSGKASKPEVDRIINSYHLNRRLFWRLVRLYLQSGCKDVSLIDKRTASVTEPKKEYTYTKRGGRPAVYSTQSCVIVDDKVRGYFEEALSDYKKGRQETYKGVYEDMLKRHYSVQKVQNGEVSWAFLPQEQIPTYWQFYNYTRKTLSAEEKDQIRTSKAEQRNNKRLLLSDAMKGVRGPADTVEVDALETDISLVSERDREQTIGRAILYLMIDVWTRVILAISVGFENNSVLGCTNLLLNLADDKAEYAKRYGITFSPELWPSNVIPRRMRMDRGADFRSDRLKEILNELGIERMLEPAAMGSMKGVVEQEFRQIQANQNDIMENKGLIEKRHDSNHHKEAMLTVKEFTAMCINYVLSHNQKHLMYYKVNKKMQDAGVEPVPIKLWEYGCRIYGNPLPITNRDQFLWSLLTPAKASLNREGIRWKDLYYINLSDRTLLRDMYRQQKKAKKIDVRYDPRDIGCLYYLRNGKLMTAPLNADKFRNEGYAGLTYQEYLDYDKAMKQEQAHGRWHNTNVSINERAVNREIVDSVQPATYASPEHMREARAIEKQEHNKENAVSKRLEQPQKDTIPGSGRKPIDETATSEKRKPDDTPLDVLDFETALRDFEDRH
ncbi:MAG: transposase family protein [Lachnospiraceae bacterium]|nr:transposase family protein [Lachnospiraceae bacterium]